MAVNYDYYCVDCDEAHIIRASYEERDSQVCPDCGEGLERLMSMPAVMRASYPDGLRRGKFQDIREASRLNQEAASAKPEIRDEIRKEISNKMGVKL